MKRMALSFPEIGLIGATRAALGAGVGMLLSEKLNTSRRRAVGWTLLGVGVLSTIPILMQLLGEHKKSEKSTKTAELNGRRHRMPQRMVH